MKKTHGTLLRRICLAAGITGVFLPATTACKLDFPSPSALLDAQDERGANSRSITAFSFPSVAATGTISQEQKTIAVTVPYGTEVTAMVATFTTTGASATVGSTLQESGVTPNDFTNPVIYKVISASARTAKYTVTASGAPSSAKAITAFAFPGLPATGTIDEAAKTIAVTVPSGTGLSALVAAFTTTGVRVEVGSVLQVSGASANDFSSPVTYTVKAEDGSSADYAVSVAVTPAASSPKLIAFASNRDGNWEIFLMKVDGSNPINLTQNPAQDDYPCLSPDGSKIAFTSDRDGGLDIYVMNADGSGQTRLTADSSWNRHPAWSPDGTRIAFSSSRDPNDEIYLMNPDGSGQTRLTYSYSYDTNLHPSWSPDGSKLAFTAYMEGSYTADISVINADGSDQRNLTNPENVGPYYKPWSAWGPRWSPDASKIVFVSNMHSDFADDGWREPITENVDIYTVAEPLESVSWYWWEGEYYPGARLTTSLGRDEGATWSSDGTRILFVSDRDGNPEIYAMNADGSGQTNLTNEPAMDAVTSLMN